MTVQAPARAARPALPPPRGRLEIARLDLRLRRRALLGYAVGLALYTLAVVALYPSFKGDKSLDKLLQSDPTLMAAFGVNGSLTSPVGWLNANVFNNFLPVVAVIVAIGYGAWCVAGQDESGALALVAVLPVSRRNLIVDKGVALVGGLLPTMLLAFGATVLGRAFDLSVPLANVVAVTVAVWLLGAVFGAIALLVGVATGSRGVAIGVSSAIAGAAYLINSFTATVHWIRPARFVSPFYWAIGDNPLASGLGFWSAASLVAAVVLLIAAAARAMEHADLH